MIAPPLGIKVPLAWLPAGLISWYDPDGNPLVLVTPWIALVGGPLPRLRTAWYGHYDSDTHFYQGSDFVLNVPHDRDFETIGSILNKGKFCLHDEQELSYSCCSGVVAVAPRLLECVLQIECVGGRLLETNFDTELCGDVASIHRDGINLNPLEIPDLCAIHPLSP